MQSTFQFNTYGNGWRSKEKKTVFITDMCITYVDDDFGQYSKNKNPT